MNMFIPHTSAKRLHAMLKSHWMNLSFGVFWCIAKILIWRWWRDQKEGINKNSRVGFCFMYLVFMFYFNSLFTRLNAVACSFYSVSSRIQCFLNGSFALMNAQVDQPCLQYVLQATGTAFCDQF